MSAQCVQFVLSAPTHSLQDGSHAAQLGVPPGTKNCPLAHSSFTQEWCAITKPSVPLQLRHSSWLGPKQVVQCPAHGSQRSALASAQNPAGQLLTH